MPGSLVVRVDLSRCVGANMCIAIAPQSFERAPDGTSVVVSPPGDDLDALQEAAENCPVQAITVER